MPLSDELLNEYELLVRESGVMPASIALKLLAEVRELRDTAAQERRIAMGQVEGANALAERYNALRAQLDEAVKVLQKIIALDDARCTYSLARDLIARLLPTGETK